MKMEGYLRLVGSSKVHVGSGAKAPEIRMSVTRFHELHHTKRDVINQGRSGTRI